VAVVTDARDIAVSDLAPAGLLRAAINLGNPVLAQGTAAAPAGVTVDIARELGARLGVPVELVCFDAARASFDALRQGRAGVGFLAIEPARAAEVAFTAPYLVIEGAYVVPAASSLTSPAEVDRAGVRVGVKEGSAYDLFLSRTLQRARLERGEDGLELLSRQGLEAGAGIRPVVSGFVAGHPGFTMIGEAFMQIRQAVGILRTGRPETAGYLAAVVEELKASGFIAAALQRSGQDPGLVAPPAPPD
jgi:polar amino acid transport system substrate-binding protein